MNRRSFLWQSVCSSLLFARAGLSHKIDAAPLSKPSDAGLTAFARGLAGKVFRPGNPNYEQFRKGYAAKFDAHPLLIVQPLKVQDIQASLSFVKDNHLPLAVRCGGHSYAGYSTCEAGVVLDMSGFRNIDIAADKGSARLGGGMLCGAVEIATARAGVARDGYDNPALFPPPARVTYMPASQPRNRERSACHSPEAVRHARGKLVATR